MAGARSWSHKGLGCANAGVRLDCWRWRHSDVRDPTRCGGCRRIVGPFLPFPPQSHGVATAGPKRESFCVQLLLPVAGGPPSLVCIHTRATARQTSPAYDSLALICDEGLPRRSSLAMTGERSLAGRQGFEPRYRGPEPRVLPLDDLPVPVRLAGADGNPDYSGSPRTATTRLRQRTGTLTLVLGQ